jgi:hypothetical protein
MVIGLLATFTPLLLERGCQRDPSFVGDFLRVAVGDRPAKSLKGLCRMPTLCGLSLGQMAKVELEDDGENQE